MKETTLLFICAAILLVMFGYVIGTFNTLAKYECGNMSVKCVYDLSKSHEKSI